MSMLTVRDLDPAVKSRLRERAALHGRSMEAEVRDILAHAVESDDHGPSFARAIVDAFHGATVDLPEYDRSGHLPRPVDL